jgi:hypothetical protein
MTEADVEKVKED